MVPKQGGGATNQTEPSVKGIHDNSVSSSQHTPPRCLEKEGPVHRVEEGPKPSTFQAPISQAQPDDK